MPRLNNFTYYAHHYFVHEVWVESWAVWSKLSPGEQWDLHCFYSPRHALSAEQLKEFRKKAVLNDPSLPQRAGRALKKLEIAYAAHGAKPKAPAGAPVVKARVTTKRQSKNRVIRVRSLVRPEPDVDRLAKALLGVARDMAKADRAKMASETDRDQDSAPAA